VFIIFIKGRAKAFDANGPVVDPDRLKQLNGVTYEQGCFTEFLADGGDYAVSKKIRRDGGMYFGYKSPDNTLSVTTTYWSKKSLTEKELHSLAQYTMFQWSDGIGEGFETESPNRYGFTVSCLLDSEVVQKPYPVIEVVEDD
jgi:hypothetical protein